MTAGPGETAEVVEATRAYEAWMRRRIKPVAADLRAKHAHMAESPFLFLRATFYRWAALWTAACPEFRRAPKVLAVGDLHIENFGTWRDAEGRLAWGVNDFDEAGAMPYAIDLVRLAASAILAIREERLALAPGHACAAILDGYRRGVAEPEGEPFMLEEQHGELRAMALGADRDPVAFWQRFTALRAVKPPGRVRRILIKALPPDATLLRFVHRTAGMGSLGRPRYVALAEHEGGLVAREAKAMLPSAWGWAQGHKDGRVRYDDIVARAARVRDPFGAVRKGYLVRRLAPHCSRIELGDFPKQRDERRILAAMGRETANVHFGTPAAIATIRRDLRRRGRHWLHEAAHAMAEATLKDWQDWRAASRR